MENIANLTYDYEKKIDKIDCVLKLIEQIVDDNNLSFGAFTEIVKLTNLLLRVRQKLKDKINELIKQNDKKILKS